jgi:hypothetical protein
MKTATEELVERTLNSMADQLDVPPSKYVEAKERYAAVGNWLDAPESELSLYQVGISPQGSFALGTAVKPLGNDDYDVDAVCLLSAIPSDWNQRDLRDAIGRRLKEPSSRYRDMLDPPHGGRRCWTVKYADESRFHLDVLSAVPDPNWERLVLDGVPGYLARLAILITDRDEPDTIWGFSNPHGFVEWFNDRMRVQLEAARNAKAISLNASVDDIEDFEVRTLLQRLIQLLKRHRDIYFNGDDDKPTSIIITTLVANAYRDEDSLTEALSSVVPAMRDYVLYDGDRYVIPNPVNPRGENFADKWQSHPRRAKLFFEWLAAVERDHESLLATNGIETLGEQFAKSYGERDAALAMTSVAKTMRRESGQIPIPVVLVPRRSHNKTSQYPVVQPKKPLRPWGCVS